MSAGVRSMRAPIWWPLFRMERWARQAALGMEVVPEVNWMLTMSWLESVAEGIGGGATRSAFRSAKGVVARRCLGSMRPEELSTRTMCFREGTVSDWSFEVKRSGTRASRRVMLLRGGLKGRFVSVPITKCEASRWVRADITWVAVNAGLSGVWNR